MNQPRKKLSVPRPWGHEQYLKDLVGKEIMIDMIDEERMFGKIVSFDRYTVFIERNHKEIRLIFKSAIKSIAETDQ